MKNIIPDEQECERLLTEVFNLSEDRVANARLVKTVAMRIGRDLKWLRDRGPNLALIRAGALLCNISAAELIDVGYPNIAKILESHIDLEFSGEFSVSEKEIIFIATKLVDENELVSVIYKYDSRIATAKNDPLKTTKLIREKEVAMTIKTAIERETGKNLEELAIADNG